VKFKSDSRSGSGFSQIFDSGSGSDGKTQNPAGVDSGSPDLWPPLVDIGKYFFKCNESVISALLIVTAMCFNAIVRYFEGICYCYCRID